MLLATGHDKSLRAIDTVAIEQRQRRQFQFGRDFSQLFRRRSATQETEGTSGVKFDVGHAWDQLSFRAAPASEEPHKCSKARD